MNFFLRFYSIVPDNSVFLKRAFSNYFSNYKSTFFVLLLLSFYTITNAQVTQTFTSSTTFAVPAGVTSITIACWGAGGGSGGAVAATKDNASGGGGGGAFSQSTFIVTPGQSLTITVGAGGTAGANTGTNGGSGGSSSVTGTAPAVNITALGGGGGGGVTVNGGTGAAGIGGAIGAYTVVFAGGSGTVGVRTTTNEVGGAGGGGAGNAGAGGNGTSTTAATNTVGGTGGSGTYPGGDGAGATTTTGSLPGVAGNAPGGGAAGAATYNTAEPGAAGGAGQVVLTYANPTCTTPLAQPTALTFPTVTSTTISGSFTAATGSPSGYLVVQSTSSTLSATPVNGTSYAAGASLGGGTVVQASTATTFTASTLTANTKYYYFIFSYNSACTGQPYYLTVLPLTNNTTTCAGAPTSLTNSTITSSSFTLGWTAPTGGGAGTITYTVDVSLTSGSFGAGNDISGYPVSGISGTSKAVSGLSPNNTYYYMVTSTNGICGMSATGSVTTALPPCTAPSAATTLVLTPSVVSITGSFTAPGTAPTGYLVIRTTSSTSPTTPVTGTTYTVGSSALGGYIVSNGNTISFTDNGLSASTQYWYWVYSYNSTACIGGPQYSLTSLNGNAVTTSICGGYSIYALDDQGYIYPLNTSTATLQTPLNNTVGPAPGTNSPNALGYNPNTSTFYFLSSVSSGAFTGYNGVSTYSTLATPFSSGAYPVVGAATIANGNGYYAIAYQTGTLYYYNASTNTWTTITTAIMDGSGNNLSTQIKNGLNNGDLIEDGYGTLWILMSSGTNFGLYYIVSPPTTAVASVTAIQAINYGTALPTSAGGTAFNGAAFDASGNLFITNLTSLFEIPNGSTTATLVGTLSGLHSGSTNIRDLAQCSYTSTPLPLVWSYFNASPQNNEVNLNWGISQASSVKGFYVERSADSKNWDTLGFVQYINGNLDYKYMDASPLTGINYYRINEIDFDGNANYSEIRIVKFSNSSTISVWPNPALDAIHVQYNGNGTNLSAQIYDELGRSIMKPAIYQGNNTITLNNMPPGVYFLLVKGNNNEVLYQKTFIKGK